MVAFGIFAGDTFIPPASDAPVPYYPDPNTWANPPQWMVTGAIVAGVLIGLAFVFFVVVKIVAARERRREAAAQPTKPWVDLNTLGGRTQGVDRHEEHPVLPEDAP